MAVYRIKNHNGSDEILKGANNTPNTPEYVSTLEPWQHLPSEADQENLDMDEIDRINSLDKEEAKGELPSRRMFKWLYSFMALLLLIAFSFWIWGDIFFSFANPLPDLGFLSRSSQLYNEPALAALKPAVVSIELASSRGSGFNISPLGVIITNRHVVENKGSIGVVFPSGQRYKGKSWEGVEGFDLAVVEIEGRDLPYVPLSSQLPQIGEEIVFIGNPLGFDWTVSQGKVKSYVALDGYDTPIILFEGPVYSGSSGSPVFNSQGEVVAVIFATLKDVEGIGLAIPIQALQGIISQIPEE